MADDGFLSRWSRRKQEVRAGKPVAEEPPAGEKPVEESAPAIEATAPPAIMQAPDAEPLPQKPPPPTIDDVRGLTFESDFKRFVAPDVAADVKNAAVKKLFADPRFNARDMMDVYADDYSVADPIPESMLKQLASAKFLGLFEEKKEDEAAREVADDVPGGNVAQSPQAPEAPEAVPHADADLRLQQDDAPAGEEPGLVAERGAAAPLDPLPTGSGKLPESDPG